MKIAIAEDVMLTRQGISAVLAVGGHETLWEAATATETLANCRHALPDLLITDVRMPPNHSDDGLLAALALRETYPRLPIVVLSQYVGNEYARRLLVNAQPGTGTGYWLKESVGDIPRFLEVVEAVAADQVQIDPKVIAHLLQKEPVDILPELSPRQREVLELMAQGRTNAQICGQLFLSATTVERVISSLFDALNLGQTDGNKRVLAVLEFLRH